MKPDIETLKPGMWVSYHTYDGNHEAHEVGEVHQGRVVVVSGGNKRAIYRIIGQFKWKSEAEAHADYANAKTRDFKKGVFKRLKLEEEQAHRDLAELIMEAAKT